KGEDQMSNYLLAFRGTPNAASTAAQEAAWANWFRGLGPTIVDTGHRVGAFTTIGSDGQPVQNGGSEPLRGYSWSRPAACRQAAVELARACPILQTGGHVEVGETFD